MEKRIGSVLILIEEKSSVSELNSIISEHGSIIIGRQGLPVQSSSNGLISLVLEGNTDQIASLTGQLGRLEGVSAKSIVFKLKNKNETN